MIKLNTTEFESKVLRVRQETPEIKSFHFSTPPEFSFKPAQHIVLELPVGGKGQKKSFSISSSPITNGYLETTKRMSQSEYSKVMCSLKPGDKVRIKGPYGMFLLDEKRDAIMLAGGIGITPFKNMIEYATEKKLPINITLVLSNKTPEEIPFMEELSALEGKNKNQKIVHTITRPQESKSTGNWKGSTGRINKEIISSIERFKEKIYYICGPPSMVNEVNALLLDLGIKKEQIKLERFTGYNGDE